MDRREFLHPNQLATATGAAIGALNELSNLSSDTPSDTSQPILLSLRRRAMATDFEILMPYGMPQAHLAGDKAFDVIDQIEGQLTIYRENSPVSYLNRRAAATLVRVDGDLMQLLQTCARLHQETEGAFDVAAGALIKAWGFFRGPPRIPSPQKRAAALDQVGMQHVMLDTDRKTVQFARPGLELNFGSIGKGRALDCAATVLREKWELPACLLQGGNSSVLTIGCQPGEPRGWPVGVRHPWTAGKRIGIVYLKDRALGTSAATHKHLKYNGRKLGHVLDPRTGWPAEGMASASAIAPTAAEADALATAFFILGMERTKAYCEAHPEIGAILLPAGDNVLPTALNLGEHEIDWTPRAE